MGNISKNFSYSEFVVSADYPELAELIVLTEKDKAKIFFIVMHWLQPLRDLTGEAIEILSGIRSTELNTNVGGVDTSDHLFKGHYSCAADIVVHAMFNRQGIFTERAIVDWFLKKGGFKQLIWYKDDLFFHFSPLTFSLTECEVLYA